MLRAAAIRRRSSPATSRPRQAVTDALFGALGVRRRPGHDEQLHLRRRAATSTTRRSAAGSGARARTSTAHAVHTHMTNSRLTDPEVLERRFPVLLEEFRIRRGPAAPGAGAAATARVRRVRFLEPMTVAILSATASCRRPRAPGGGTRRRLARIAAVIGSRKRMRRTHAVAAAMRAGAAASRGGSRSSRAAPGSATPAPRGRSGASWSCACAPRRCRRSRGPRPAPPQIVS